jgi:hypothetical protein
MRIVDFIIRLFLKDGMAKRLISLLSSGMATIVVAMLLICAHGDVARGQSFDSALCSLERVIGPILPPNGLGASFRSEVGSSIWAASLDSAVLSAPNIGSIELRRAAILDETPLRLQIHSKLRLWRLAYNLSYDFWQTRRNDLDFGTLDFSALKTGFDFDVIQLNWLTAGINFNFTLTDQYFKGTFLPPTWLRTPVSQANFTPKKPNTVGGYIRYVPPEIMNFPVHFEAYYYAPMSGSRLTTYGASLAFRPQIYRFDTAIKLLAEKDILTFVGDSKDATIDWKLETEHTCYGVELALYF